MRLPAPALTGHHYSHLPSHLSCEPEKTLEGVKIRAIIRTVSRIIFDPTRLQAACEGGGGFCLPPEMQR